MKVATAFEIDVDEGTRPSTGFRRVDQVVRASASFLSRLRHMRELGEARVCDAVQAAWWPVQVRYDGHDLGPSRDRLPMAR